MNTASNKVLSVTASQMLYSFQKSVHFIKKTLKKCFADVFSKNLAFPGKIFFCIRHYYNTEFAGITEK